MNGGMPVLSGRIWSTVRAAQRSRQCLKSRRASGGPWLCGGGHSSYCWRSEVNTDCMCCSCVTLMSSNSSDNSFTKLLIELKLSGVKFLMVFTLKCLSLRLQWCQWQVMCDKYVVCSCWGLCILPVPVHTCACRVASPSVSSDSSLRSSTWLIQLPCPFCWRRTMVCTTTTLGFHKDPLTSLCSGTHFLFLLVSLVLGIIIIVLITVCLRLQLIYQITNMQLFNKLCVCVHILCRRFSSGTREKVLRWLFPKAELCPLLDSAGTIVQRCLVTHSTNSQSKVSSHAFKLTDCTLLLKVKLRIKI